MYTQTPVLEEDAVNNTQPIRIVVDRPSRAGLAYTRITNLKVSTYRYLLKLKLTNMKDLP